MLLLLMGLTEGLMLFGVLVIVTVVLLVLLAPRGQRVIARKPELEAAEVKEEEAPAPAAPAAPEKPEEAAPPPPKVPGQLDRPIEAIEGIGPVYKEKLRGLGITTVGDLLNAGKTREGREGLAKESGSSPTDVLHWVNMADLFRIKGVDEEYSELLEASGVDTVVELSKRNPINLHPQMVKTNMEKKLVRKLPTLEQVRDWIEQSKKLQRVVEY